MKKVVIDAGHGGADPGASGNGIIEKELTLSIAQYIYKRLKKLGVDAKIIRTTDETITPSERVKRVLDSYGNSNDVIVLSNHINAGGGNGAEVVYALRNNETLSKTILNELAKEGQVIRKYYQRRLPSNQNRDYYFILRETGNTEAVLIEYGFLDTKEDAERLKANYENYAEAVVRALASYIGFNYTPPTTSDTYVVKRGDTLYSIANKFGLSVSELKNLNNLTSNDLSVGQILKINNNYESNNTYTVKSGDTLYKIANEFNTTVNELKNLNNLTSNMLNVGQILLLPNNEIVNPEQYLEHVVKSGDTLYSIAKIYNTTVDGIKELNNLSSNNLRLGQILLIPLTSNPQTNITYTVKSGDSLYSIAKRYGVTVNAIKELNNLSSNLLSINQQLLIPV